MKKIHTSIKAVLPATAIALTYLWMCPAISEPAYVHAVPASVVLKTAERHGWRFRAIGRVPEHCIWQSHSLKARAATRCRLELFLPPDNQCPRLKPGWRIVDIKFSHPQLTWLEKPHDSLPTARLQIITGAKPIEVRPEQIILSSPSSSSVNLAEAFAYCSG